MKILVVTVLGWETAYMYHSVIINVIEINRNQSLIVLQKYGSLIVSHSTRPMTSFCIFIAYINTEGILFNVKITR
jgi:hypothetical protein